MSQERRGPAGIPDPHAMEVARVIQEAVNPDLTILYGSRAVGDHHEDSDLDIMVVTDGTSAIAPESRGLRAARAFIDENPPWLDIAVLVMKREQFDRCRLANQHIAGQAVNHGVIMNEAALGLPGKPGDGYPGHWPATRRCIEMAQGNGQHFSRMVDEDHWFVRLMDHTAHQAAENALRGWISTHNDPWRFRHSLNALWRRVNELEDWSDPGTKGAREAAGELFELVSYGGPLAPDAEDNWLTEYADPFDLSDPPRAINREEQQKLRDVVERLVESAVVLIHLRSGTGDRDVYPDGMRPWERG